MYFSSLKHTAFFWKTSTKYPTAITDECFSKACDLVKHYGDLCPNHTVEYFKDCSLNRKATILYNKQNMPLNFI